MSKTIAVAGKGGTGKSTLSALIIMELVKKNKTPVLAIDADPNNCLNEWLGLDFEKTVVSLADDLMKDKDDLPAGFTKERYIDLNFQSALVESKGFDLIVMGHPEREGCYCAANNMLKNCMEKLSANYPYTVLDNEAGMEHLSRRTARNIDELLIVANPSKISIKSAGRILKLVDELKLNVKSARTVINEPAACPEEHSIPERDDIAGLVPHDEELYRISIRGGTVFELGENSKAVKAVSELLGNLGI